MGKKLNKASFPMQGEVFKRETTNGYYNPTSLQSAIIQKKNSIATQKRIKLAKNGVNIPQTSTRASEPVQSEAFKNGNRK
tara:strand:+ start:586 stop:825 length:240 start_codon:yes stop_codon:yes gene_type:complete